MKTCVRTSPNCPRNSCQKIGFQKFPHKLVPEQCPHLDVASENGTEEANIVGRQNLSPIRSRLRSDCAKNECKGQRNARKNWAGMGGACARTRSAEKIARPRYSRELPRRLAIPL